MTSQTDQARALAVQADPRWAMVCLRKPAADGLFVYAVKTTGVFCRPSCASRRARPENVVFFPSASEAAGAGFRDCKRCQPGGPPPARGQAAKVVALCRLIETSEEIPSLEVLARSAGLSVSRAHRLFKEITGLTPRAYAAARREERVREGLRAATSVTHAIYDAGYNSSGRFYDQSKELLGMTPTDYKAGGAKLPIRFAVSECSLGAILVAATGRGVCAVLLGDDPGELARDLKRRFPRADLLGADPAFGELVTKVVGLIEEPKSAATLPLDIRGTAFQQRVWKALARIPAGATATYAQIAGAIGAPTAARAVAQACAANALAVVIPCHRVVRSDGDLSGYRWGVERKRQLLEREARAITPRASAVAR